ncbi:MAG: hypothetical protein HC923_06710 [Myxococcales bacterium]|nr:hypothetical protein [Myxococcales bacterium]
MDGIELAERTPVTVERPRDDALHVLELGEGETGVRDTFRIDREVVSLSYALRPNAPTSEPTGRVLIDTFPPSQVWFEGRRLGDSGSWLAVPANRTIDLALRSERDEVLVRLRVPAGGEQRILLDLHDVARFHDGLP